MNTVPPLPDIYLDSSVLVEAMFSGLPHYEASDAFCARVANDGNRIYFSQLLRLEVGEAVRRLATKQQLPLLLRQQHGLDEWATSEAIRREWMSFGLHQFERLLANFSEAIEVPFRAALWRRSIDLIGRYGLRASDAVHAATALQEGLEVFATNDGDFRRVTLLRVMIVRDEYDRGRVGGAL